MKTKSSKRLDSPTLMEIQVIASSGEGTTLLSAFDNALVNANACNYNLIRLSSIIPPHSRIIKLPQYEDQPDKFGQRLYVVVAEIRSNEAGKFLAAGLGWYQLEDGRGFFVEHEVIGETKTAVKSEIKLRIRNSLKDMCKFRGIKYQERHLKSVVSYIKIKDKPACALAMAIYKSEPWQ